MPKAVQSNFSGGMNLFTDRLFLENNEYGLAFNARHRTGSLTGVKAPVKFPSPIGKKQGVYVFDNYIIMFVAGRAFYRLLNEVDWKLISGFSMSPTADRIYTVAVPASITNYNRFLSGDSFYSTVTSDKLTTDGTPAGLVVQDGTSQPWFIDSLLNASPLQTYDQWTIDFRRYVPIGKQMAFVNGILFIVSPDGKTLYRSVSGRPLDFVVNIDQDGNKGGDATTTAYAVSYETITTLYVLNSGQLLIATPNAVYPINFDYTRTLFGEPTFSYTEAITTGIINHESIVEILGDYAFIDKEGIRSFNAVMQLQNEGRNSVFSLKVSKLFSNIVQNELSTAAINFNNYAHFAVNTTEGYGILVFDTLTQQWAAFDSVFRFAIKQFAKISIAGVNRLFCITENELYELYAGSVGQVSVYTKDLCEHDPDIDIKANAVRVILNGGNDNAPITFQEISNNAKGNVVTLKTNNTNIGIRYPVTYPVLYDNENNVNNLKADFSRIANEGFRVGFVITWDGTAALSHIAISAFSIQKSISMNQQVKVYGS